ncbi:uncharacterized protein MYCFIDRAFT_213115 [Pseudocercospora fijiensis CIRAD86]|uniref:LIM-domain binding protein-domain-containing protein n=1 Tax=Pseudocercospora fijiensis (strain CIRAD86) TaxID=383855 RepID=N1Q6J9_PSEFD|nr:uncharacterized protein MYCFIDRAFT_213115 [Pseudocercospora fijiensis CIRAD86]EME88029.1 hypothetical protein MYCFIDRAFT_213115 [Pseudocercospora fijiensis CIRAD86]
MMAAYQPTPGGMHPGMPHGHPGMAPNPGQHMGQPMQMHPGVSGAPQQAGMMGMQPSGNGMGPGGMGGQHPGAGMAMPAHMGGQSMAGGIPNSQALSHLTPQQQLAHQQAQMAAMQSNPQLAMQHHQMRLRQQQMMQQAQANGMMQPGMQMNPQLAQQMQQQQNQHAMSQQGGQAVQLTPHLQAQQMQMMQQRMQQQQQAQQQHQNQMAQQLAMQQQHSQQSNQGQQQPANPQGTPAQAAAQQMRPQSRMANPNEQAQPGQQPQHPQQAQSQQGQPQAQQGGQPQQGQQPTPQQQQAMSLQQRQQIALLQRQQAFQARQMQAAQQQQPTSQSGMFILRLLNFSTHLASFTPDIESQTANGKNVTHWHNFVEKHFAPEGRLIHSFDDAGPHGKVKTFEVLRPNVARYFYTYFDSGASSLRLHTENAREVPHANGSLQVSCQHATFSVFYPNGARLEMTGSLHVLFSAGSDQIDILSFQTTGTEEVISRGQIEKVLSDFSPTMANKASPKMAKNKLPKAQQKLQEAESRLTIEHFPKTPKGTMGFTSKVQHFLEIGETMNVMSDLMHYAQDKKMRPEQALEALVAQYESQPNGQSQPGNPQINLPPNGVPQGSTTPNMRNMQMPQNGQAFSSPSMGNMQMSMNGSPHLGNTPGTLGAPNMGMPNSHTPSPHQSSMTAPQMMPQHSQQGTNSSVASENTSPNVNNNKRRRSAVKVEGDDGGSDANANRVKPSPRMAKKPKP